MSVDPKMLERVHVLKNQVEAVFKDHLNKGKAEGIPEGDLVGETVSSALSVALAYAAAIELPPEKLMHMYMVAILAEIERCAELDTEDKAVTVAPAGGPDPTSN